MGLMIPLRLRTSQEVFDRNIQHIPAVVGKEKESQNLAGVTCDFGTNKRKENYAIGYRG